MKKYWKSIDQREAAPDPLLVKTEETLEKQQILDFLENHGTGLEANRRDFLKFFGFSFATAAVLSSCKNPVNKAIPYLFKPEEVNPGESVYYASTFFDGKDYCPVVVKVRDGRPIKIEGNDRTSFSGGGTHARVQASILGLYDQATRLEKPALKGKESDWKTMDGEIIKALTDLKTKNEKVVLLTSTLISPSLLAAIKDLMTVYPNLVHITWDPVSFYAIREAQRLLNGLPLIPRLHFDKADLIVGMNCDFLGTWLSPAEFTSQYTKRRKLNKDNPLLSKHIQFETGLTLTGSNADERYTIKPSEEKLVLAALYHQISKKAGLNTLHTPPSPVPVDELADSLWSHKGRSLLVSGTNDIACQVLTSAINTLLGNEGVTIAYQDACQLGSGNDRAMMELLDDMEMGKVGGLIMHQVNPAYDFPYAERFVKGLAKLSLSVSTTSQLDETLKHCTYSCPDNHYLESWTDAQPYLGMYSLGQPVIQKLFDTRSFLETINTWCGSSLDSYQYIRNYWEKNLFSLQKDGGSFNTFWTKILQDGVYEMPVNQTVFKRNETVVPMMLSNIAAAQTQNIELQVYESIAIGNGQYANNPWLQELPDPVSKVTWDNYVAISPKTAKELGLIQGDLVRVADLIELPVLVQPGQAPQTISIALGYGRTDTGKAGKTGKNAYPLVQIREGVQQYSRENVSLKKTGMGYLFAQTQIHHVMEGRPIIRETNITEYQKNPAAGNEMHEEIVKHHQTLYPEVEYPVHHWALSVDLNACTGCSSCMIACQAENNIPVVGKKEVSLKRSMHWIRVDRYYSEDENNPEVVFQPMMCQHCDNAPCENVCPVAATTHSQDGLNQMAYNRCIGTKYCINNCPYKVRRFNWYRYVDNPAFDFGTETDLGKMVLNPDVTVRERGVVEKCSLCVQRIQEAKLKAKLEGRVVADGDIMPACVQACPAKAIVFGDQNNPESKVNQLFKDPRNYNVLEELHTLPKVGYLTKVRNQQEGQGHS